MLFYTVNKQFEVIQIKTIFAQYVTIVGFEKLTPLCYL